MELDGRAATQKVKEYFRTAHGEFGLIGFEVDQVTYDEKARVWIVECHFYTSMLAGARTKYQVKVSGGGEIKEVRRVSPASK